MNNLRFGAKENDLFLEMYAELEKACAQIDGEIAYLDFLYANISDTEAITTDALNLPEFFPIDGRLFEFEDSKISLYGYKIINRGNIRPSGKRVLFYNVNHETKTAFLSDAGADLMAANQIEEGGPLQATAIDHSVEGIILYYKDTELILPYEKFSRYDWIQPGDIIDVYPEIWTLKDITDQFRKKDVAPLRVRLEPRISQVRRYWSPLMLKVTDEQMQNLVRAYNTIEEKNAQSQKWKVHFSGCEGGEDLPSKILFTIDEISLVTRPDFVENVFILEEVRFGPVKMDFPVEIFAEVQAYIPNKEVGNKPDPSLFPLFLKTLKKESDMLRETELLRNTALHLRKLSMIYQSYQTYLERQASCGFLPRTIKKESGDKIIIEGVIIDRFIPQWLENAANNGTDINIFVCSPERCWKVADFSWIKRDILQTCKLELAAKDKTLNPIYYNNINRIEYPSEGLQQESMSRALEMAIRGNFISDAVHRQIFKQSGESIDNINEGTESVFTLLNSNEPVIAIWGPPGTGKTTLLAKWIISLFPVKKPETWPNILITAPTHVAVNGLMEKIRSMAPNLSEEMVRYGNVNKISDTGMEDIWHETLLKKTVNPEANDELRESQERWQKLRERSQGREAIARWELQSRHIHGATCSGISRRDYALKNRSFDIVIVDEAGKAFGAELMIPAVIAKRIIFVGDHRQLPPTITSDVLDAKIEYPFPVQKVEELLEKNMFQAIFETLPESNKGMLNISYRMHPDISRVVSDMFYGGMLRSHRENTKGLLFKKHITFFDMSADPKYKHSKTANSTSLENEREREVLKTILNNIYKEYSHSNIEILIICCYKKQRDRLRNEILKESNNESAQEGLKIRVLTVDEIQGGEGDIVILLMTRSYGNTQFLLDRQRINVALSRAKENVVIIGHLNCLTRGDKGPFSDMVRIGKKNDVINIVKIPKTTQ